jgi:hypothetical protein
MVWQRMRKLSVCLGHSSATEACAYVTMKSGQGSMFSMLCNTCLTVPRTFGWKRYGRSRIPIKHGRGRKRAGREEFNSSASLPSLFDGGEIRSFRRLCLEALFLFLRCRPAMMPSMEVDRWCKRSQQPFRPRAWDCLVRTYCRVPKTEEFVVLRC